MNFNIVFGGIVIVFEVVFGKDFNEFLVYQVVIVFLVGVCQGFKVQKNCVVVSGGGCKFWCQKGIGWVCVGIICSLLWCGGGKMFVVEFCDFFQKVNCKMYCGVLCCIFFELVCQECLVVVDEFNIDLLKIKQVVFKLKDLELSSVLIVISEVDENFYLVVCNLFKVDICDVSGVDLVSFIVFEKVLVMVLVLKQFEEVLV